MLKIMTLVLGMFSSPVLAGQEKYYSYTWEYICSEVAGNRVLQPQDASEKDFLSRIESEHQCQLKGISFELEIKNIPEGIYSYKNGGDWIFQQRKTFPLALNAIYS